MAMLQQIQDMLQRGQYAEAVRQLQSLCRDRPGDPDLLMHLAAVQAQLNDLPGVISTCRLALQSHPEHLAFGYNLAVALQTLKHHSEAIDAYRQVLNHSPRHTPSLNNLAALLIDLGQPDAAVRHLLEALEVQPDFVTAYNTLGLAYDKLGKHADAQQQYRRVLELDPRHNAARANHIRSLQLQGDLASAMIEIERFVADEPNHQDALLLKASILRADGKHKQAIEYLTTLLQHNPRNAALHYELALAATASKNTALSIEHYQRTLELMPDHAQALNNLGSLYHQQGRNDLALKYLRRAGEVVPHLSEVQMNLATVLWSTGHDIEAHKAALAALALRPGHRDYLQRFSQIIADSKNFIASQALHEALMACLNDPGIDQQRLTGSVITLLQTESGIKRLIADCQSDELPTWKDFLTLLDSQYSQAFRLLSRNTLLSDAAMERCLRKARHSALFTFSDPDGHTQESCTDHDLALLCCIAHQCYNNEYVYVTTAQERARLDCLKRPPRDNRRQCLIFALLEAMFRPLAQGSAGEFREVLLDDSSADIRSLGKKHFIDPAAEAVLRPELNTLSAIEDDISRAVRNQYEESPYPRWLSVNILTPKTYDEVLRGDLPHLTIPDFGSDKIDILIAGCGTGKHAIQTATRFKDSSVLAIDLSRSSLAYGLRKTREYGIDNIEFACADILQLAHIDRRFHIIESVGVLHHLGDPLAGLMTLRRLLHRQGMMNLGFYSRLARRVVHTARDHFTMGRGLPDNEAIRQYREEILSLNKDAPLRSLTQMQDFYSLSDCRDLIFHTQEHSYNLVELNNLLEQARLQFCGFELADAYTKNQYRREYPDDATATNLTNWHSYEQRHPDTFTGMYVFWCRAID